MFTNLQMHIGKTAIYSEVQTCLCFCIFKLTDFFSSFCERNILDIFIL